MSQTPAPADPDPTRPRPLRTASERDEGSRAPGGRRDAWLVPLLVLVGAFLVVTLLFVSRPEPRRTHPLPPVPFVEVVEAMPRSLRLSVVAHGTVEPRTESDLVAEVRGRVTHVAPALEAGGTFEAGDELLRLDGREYRIAVDRNRAAVKLARSESRLAAAEAERRRNLVARGVASDADLEQFENRAAVAAASLDQARANLAQASLDLERTVLRAPFAGRVRERSVDLGQFVSPGSLLARIYAVDYAEVRLPIRTEELAYLDLPEAGESGAPITLAASLGGRAFEWPAELVRTEGEIDPRTRMINVVARVDDPHDPPQGVPPLPAGLFVRAEIQGRRIDDVYVVPPSALRDADQVYLIEEGRLAFRDVEVIRRGTDQVIVGKGLAPGEAVIVTPMRAATNGMNVRARTPATTDGSAPAPESDAARKDGPVPGAAETAP